MKSQTRERRLCVRVEGSIINIYLAGRLSPLQSIFLAFASRVFCSYLFPICVDLRGPRGGSVGSCKAGRGGAGARGAGPGGMSRGPGPAGRARPRVGARGRPRGRASRGAGLSNFPGICCFVTFQSLRPLKKKKKKCRRSARSPDPT